mgnify:CR=1 FL=1
MRLRQAANRFLSALVETSEEEIVEFVRGWLTEKLKTVSVADLHNAVQKNTDLWNAAPDRYKLSALALAKKHKTLYLKYRSLLTPENALKIMAMDRPDLASYIINDSTGKAMGWFTGMLDKISMRLWERGDMEGGT